MHLKAGQWTMVSSWILPCGSCCREPAPRSLSCGPCCAFVQPPGTTFGTTLALTSTAVAGSWVVGEACNAWTCVFDWEPSRLNKLLSAGLGLHSLERPARLRFLPKTHRPEQSGQSLAAKRQPARLQPILQQLDPIPWEWTLHLRTGLCRLPKVPRRGFQKHRSYTQA